VPSDPTPPQQYLSTSSPNHLHNNTTTTTSSAIPTSNLLKLSPEQLVTAKTVTGATKTPSKTPHQNHQKTIHKTQTQDKAAEQSENNSKSPPIPPQRG
jgi:hypothetical protein